MTGPRLPGVHKLSLPTPYPVGPVNVYYLPGPDPTLVDTGPNTPEALAALASGLAASGCAVEGVRRVLLTHGHPDHYGLAGWVRARSGASVWAGEGDRRMIEDHPAELFRWVAFLRASMPEAGFPPEPLERLCRFIEGRHGYGAPCPIDRILREGDLVETGGRRLRVLLTPGHTPGSLCLYDEAGGILFAGDHLLPKITPNPILQIFSDFLADRFDSLVHYHASLDRLATLPHPLVLPGHGDDISDLPVRLEGVRGHTASRKARLLDLLAEGERPLYEVARALFPEAPEGEMLLALFDATGHLDLLREAGRVEYVRRGGLITPILRG